MTAGGFHSPVCSQRAFTLLELIIATAVGAVVLIVIQTTFFGALRLHNTTHDRIDSDAVLQRTLSVIRRDFAGLMMPGGTLSGQLQTTNFSTLGEGSYGDRVTPDIYTNSGKIDGWNPFSEVQMVAYYLAPGQTDADGKNLVRVVTRNLLPVQESVPDEQTLLHGVDSATLLFYDGSGWIDTWDSSETSTLPGALKFSLVMKTSTPGMTAPPPIELTVPVMVTTRTSERLAAEEEAPL
jgi:type II secretion system protein J